MILSFAHRFLFIKTIKTAGSSVEVVLSQLCDENDVVTPLSPPEAGHRPRNFEQLGFYNHVPARQILTRIGRRLWDGLLKITVERNPWDKMVSWYAWQKHLSGLDEPFCEFIDLCARAGKWPYVFPAASELYTLDGVIGVDRIIRYESLTAEFDALLKDVGGAVGMPLARAKSGYRDHGTSYRDHYDARSRKQVSERYAFEIDALGYTF